MTKAFLIRTLLAFCLFPAIGSVNASVITYNFGGVVTSVSDPSGVLVSTRNVRVGDSFHVIYQIDTDAQASSSAIGSGEYRNSQFIDAILRFQFYVENENFVDTVYRLQTLRNISGSRNGRPTDWIELSTDGGIDNYATAYGLNAYGEFIDSYLELVDLTGTALEAYNRTAFGNIPLSFDINDFSFGFLMLTGEPSSSSSTSYQIRGSIFSFSNSSFHHVPAPSAVLLIAFCFAIKLNSAKYRGAN